MNIVDVIKEHGVENITIIDAFSPINTVFGMIAYTSSEDLRLLLPAKIVTDKHNPEDNYKIQYKPIVDGYETKTLYVSDFETRVNYGRIGIYVVVKEIDANPLFQD